MGLCGSDAPRASGDGHNPASHEPRRVNEVSPTVGLGGAPSELSNAAWPEACGERRTDEAMLVVLELLHAPELLCELQLESWLLSDDALAVCGRRPPVPEGRRPVVLAGHWCALPHTLASRLPLGVLM